MPLKFDTIVGRHTVIANKILFVDGLSGTGKTMMGPILATFNRVEIQRLEHIYQYACQLQFLQRIKLDAATELIKLYIDLACYNAMIGRESNFRWKDLSGVFNSPGGWKYLFRLLHSDGDQVMDRVRKKDPIMQIGSQQILAVGETLFEALGDRLLIIEMVRHPLYLLEHWQTYMDRFGTDPRDFNIWIEYDNSYLPWFAIGWEEKYLAANSMDKAIFTIDWYLRKTDQSLGALEDKARDQVLIIPFERFVIEPDNYMQQIEQLLNATVTSSTKSVLRREKIPRKLVTAGRDLPIYRRYGWKTPAKERTENEEIKDRWLKVTRQASDDAIDTLDKMCRNYEETYMKDVPQMGLVRAL